MPCPGQPNARPATLGPVLLCSGSIPGWNTSPPTSGVSSGGSLSLPPAPQLCGVSWTSFLPSARPPWAHPSIIHSTKWIFNLRNEMTLPSGRGGREGWRKAGAARRSHGSDSGSPWEGVCAAGVGGSHMPTYLSTGPPAMSSWGKECPSVLLENPVESPGVGWPDPALHLTSESWASRAALGLLA